MTNTSAISDLLTVGDRDHAEAITAAIIRILTATVDTVTIGPANTREERTAARRLCRGGLLVPVTECHGLDVQDTALRLTEAGRRRATQVRRAGRG